MGPLNKRYWKLMRFLMSLVSLWPGEALGELRSRISDCYHVFTIINQTFIFLAQIHYIKKNINEISLIESGHMWISLFVTVLSGVRILLPFEKNYGKIANTFFRSFHLTNYRSSDAFSAKITNKVDTISMYLVYYQWSLNCLGNTLFNLIPVYNNYTSGAFSALSTDDSKLQTIIYMSVPYLDYTRNLRDWIFVSLYDYYMGWQWALILATMDIYFFLIVFQIMGHILIIENEFINMKPPASRELSRSCCRENEDWYSEEENRQVREKLKTLLNHHNDLVEFMAELSMCFGNVMLINYLFHMVSGCVLLLMLMQGGDSYIRYGPVAAILFGQLIMLSLILEHLDTLSGRLGDAVYSTPWYRMDVGNQKMVLLILRRVQTPIQFKAKSVVDIGVKPMLGILKSTYSYFMFLNQQG